MKESYALICENCHSVFKNALNVSVPSRTNIKKVDLGAIDISSTGVCPICQKKVYFFSTDNNIADAVADLDSVIGFQTNFSCQGHCKLGLDREGNIDPHIDNPYVCFSVLPRFRQICKANNYGYIIFKIDDELLDLFKDNGWTDIHINMSEYNDLLNTKELDLSKEEDRESIKAATKISVAFPYETIDKFIVSLLDSEEFNGLPATKSNLKKISDRIEDYLKEQCVKLDKALKKYLNSYRITSREVVES